MPRDSKDYFGLGFTNCFPMFKQATSFLRENSDFYSMSSASISLEAYALREILQLEKKNDFWNRSAFSGV